MFRATASPIVRCSRDSPNIPDAPSGTPGAGSRPRAFPLGEFPQLIGMVCSLSGPAPPSTVAAMRQSASAPAAKRGVPRARRGESAHPVPRIQDDCHAHVHRVDRRRLCAHHGGQRVGGRLVAAEQARRSSGLTARARENVTPAKSWSACKSWPRTLPATSAPHSSRVEEINQELISAGGKETETVVSAVAKLIEANQQMQQQLDTAEQRLEEQARLAETHAAEARTDALTGLANRRALDDELARRCAEFRPPGQGVFRGHGRHRSLQAIQRRPRPSGGRRGPAGRGQGPAAHRPGNGYRRPLRRRGIRRSFFRKRRWPRRPGRRAAAVQSRRVGEVPLRLRRVAGDRQPRRGGGDGR